MSIFVQKTNVINGSKDWVIEHEDYDYHQEVARSSFADMLHDTERNEMYEAALKIAIERTHQDGKKAIVLDIGTGTGLLSMMAVRNGADKVTACEAFKPMSECAVKIIETNGFKDKIKVIPKQSIHLTVGENGDLDERCNILVTEVFDTELIGEGALSTFNHAHKVLLTEDCIVVPNSATIYAQVVECPLVQKWNRISDIYQDGKLLLRVPDNIKNCNGSAAVHDIQLSQIPADSFKTLVKPIEIFSFNWSKNIPLKRTTIQSLKAECDGEAQALFMWWDLKMDIENKIVLSCAPYWNHFLSKGDKTVKIPWRDHWMQAVYYFPRDNTFKKGEELNLLSTHDEYSLWFNIKKDLKLNEEDYQCPNCLCTFHVLPRSRIGQINDSYRNKVLIDDIRLKVEAKDVLVIGDGFYLSLIASNLNARKIFILDSNSFSKKITMDFILVNNISNIAVYSDIEKLMKEIPENSIDLVLAEPYFVSSILPWDNLCFYFSLRKMWSLLKKNVQIYPSAGCVKAVVVQFDDLHKIRTPLKECQGFKMDNFDELIEESSDISDELVEAQPLWEYPATALSAVEEIFTFDFTTDTNEVIEINGILRIESDQPCNGIAIWVDWLHGETNDPNIISSGPIAPPKIGKKVKWDRNCRQGVCLFENKYVNSLSYRFKLDLINANIKFDYE